MWKPRGRSRPRRRRSGRWSPTPAGIRSGGRGGPALTSRPVANPGAGQVLISSRRVYGRRGKSVERILVAEPEQRLVYEVIGGLPVRHYRGEVTLTPAGD